MRIVNVDGRVVVKRKGNNRACLQALSTQMQTWQRRWSLGTESGAARLLRLSININKRMIFDSLFQSVRNKLGSSKKDARQ
jgi:hypothetical protein